MHLSGAYAGPLRSDSRIESLQNPYTASEVANSLPLWEVLSRVRDPEQRMTLSVPENSSASAPDPMELMDHAKALANRKRYQEALEAYLWCFDYGDIAEPAFAGVRASFLICNILDLSKQHRPALDALVARRNASGQRLHSGEGTERDALDFTSLNRYFRQEYLSVQLFDSLTPGSTLWHRVAWDVRKYLLEKRRYAELLRAFDPEVTFERNVADLQVPACDGDPRFKTAMRDKLVRQCAPLVEALAGTGQHQRALELARNILRAVGRPPLRRTLADHARRAGDLPLAEVLGVSKRAGARGVTRGDRASRRNRPSSEEA
jgi:hypothetical protein